MKKIVMWGALGHSKVLLELVLNEYEVLAFGDQDAHLTAPIENVPIYNHIEDLRILTQQAQEVYFAVAVAGVYRGMDRYKIHEELKGIGLLPANLIHQTAYVASNNTMKEGNQILAQAVLGAESKIGSQCIINTGASVDHETVLGNGVHICPGAHVLGDVCIEDYVTVGAGAVILPHLHIGKAAVIGSGAIVLQNVPSKAVVVGNPGRVIKYI